MLAGNVLPAMPRPGSRRIRLWSAGCGTGEQAWSIAMIVAEAELSPALEVEILATDGDRRALQLAGEAVYRDDQMQGVSAERRRRHFVRGVGPRRGLWRVIAPLRDRVELDQLDLGGRWSAAAPFDAVFCDKPIARLDPRNAHRLARRLAEVVAPGGALFLGHAPSASQDLPGLSPWGPDAFRKLTL